MSGRRHDRYGSHLIQAMPSCPHKLAMYLDNFREHGRGAWPKQSTLATRFGVSVRTIQRWTRRLEDQGLVAVERHKPHQDHITGRWRRRSNRYRCTFQKSKRPRQVEKTLLTPTRHESPHKGPFREPCNGSAPEQVMFHHG